MSESRSSRPPRSPQPAARKPARKAGNAPLPHEVRIIGGAWKRTKLPVADKPGLRPTPDRVRETLFNWLGQDLTGWRCVDVFAGTGALGFEAASRGAASVLMYENDPALVLQLQKVQARLGEAAEKVVRIERGDGVAALARLGSAAADLVFIDPPFDSELFLPALRAAATALAPGGFLYLEAPAAGDAQALGELDLVVYRHLKAGAVHAHLLTRAA
jgi:16S rRNA (guanine(966)-N(2))-methyltransferase RsmD